MSYEVPSTSSFSGDSGSCIHEQELRFTSSPEKIFNLRSFNCSTVTHDYDSPTVFGKEDTEEKENEECDDLRGHIRRLSIGVSTTVSGYEQRDDSGAPKSINRPVKGVYIPSQISRFSIDVTPVSAFSRLGKKRPLEDNVNKKGVQSPQFKTPQRKKKCSPWLKNYRLKVVTTPQISSTGFQSIDGKELVRLMTSMSEVEFKKNYIIVDCRYPFEYNGGHIKGAINVHNPADLESIFFPKNDAEFEETVSRIPIFYCEYSQKRGPTAAEHLRRLDRIRNEDRYPLVYYKEIYVLDRGYKKFREDGCFNEFCNPDGYVRMLATPHRKSLSQYQMHKSRKVHFGPVSKKKYAFATAGRRSRNSFIRSIESPSQFTLKKVTPSRAALKHI